VPKPGFMSITVREDVYYYWAGEYDKNQKALNLKGINSLSAYITSILDEKRSQ